VHKLFFDIIATGHHSEYISHLITYLCNINNDNDNNTYSFVVHPDFETRFPDIVEKTKSNLYIHWYPITTNELNTVEHLSMAKASFANFKLMNAYAKRLEADHVCLLYLNTFQLALSVKKPTYTLSGILFQQFSRMPRTTWKDKLKYQRKKIITKLYAKNKKIKAVYILNDSKTATLWNSWFDTTIFKMLPDPVPLLEPLETFNIYDHYGVTPENRIYLHIGSLGNRKGTFESIEAAHFISKEEQNKTTLLLVGKTEDKTTAQKIKETIHKVQRTSQVQLIWDDSFVSNEQMKSIFNQCYAVLIPYKNSEASSGILGHAIASKKPVITTGSGLLKELVETNEFGVLLDKVTPEKIAETITKLKIIDTNEERYSLFLNEHTPQIFSELLI
tara:strand:+ start:16479 stop:17645 length:1167 start_codon:yes stop_codon:yes gene_type:complete